MECRIENLEKDVGYELVAKLENGLVKITIFEFYPDQEGAIFQIGYFNRKDLTKLLNFINYKE